jgi:molybdate transport system substrate-binding protein
MRRLGDAGLLAGDFAVFAHNTPVIVVPADNPAGIQAPEDLAQPGLRLVLAAEDVPIGGYARQAILNLAAISGYPPGYAEAVLANVVSSEATVRAVLAKIELGEGDAGIVYRTDAAIAGDAVAQIDIPAEANVVAAYPIAVVAEAAEPEAATQFVEFVLGEEGRRVLAEFGFTLP